MKERGNKLIKKASKFLNFSPDLLCGGITITVYARNQAVIAGYKKIIEFDDNILKVSDNEEEVTIFGSNFILTEMTDEGINIEGKIKSVEIEEKRIASRG